MAFIRVAYKTTAAKASELLVEIERIIGIKVLQSDKNV